MAKSLTMKSTKSLFIVVLLAIYIQNIECKNVKDEPKPADAVLPIKAYPLATRERDLRGLRDVWNQVKRSALSSWNFLKKVAEDTRNKIRSWANSARVYAVRIEKSFEEHLHELQNMLRDTITDLLGTGKLVQECLKSESKNIQGELKALLEKMTECVSNQIKQIAQIKGKHAELIVNDTLFITELDTKLDACEADKANYEECLYTVRGLVYDDIKDLDDHIQKTNMESRSLADSIRNSLTSCSLQNLADASSYITFEMMQVVKCVLKSKGVNEAILE